MHHAGGFVKYVKMDSVKSFCAQTMTLANLVKKRAHLRHAEIHERCFQSSKPSNEQDCSSDLAPRSYIQCHGYHQRHFVLFTVHIEMAS